MSERVLLVSIDGVTPRSIDSRRTPELIRLARSGAGCFQSRTVSPPVTLPAHASMLCGVSPSVHGALDNDATVQTADAPTLLWRAREAGLATASSVGWAPIDRAIEPGAVERRFAFDGGYDEADDDVVVDHALSQLADGSVDLMLVYLGGPDLAGHDHGWGSSGYDAAVSRADRRLGRLVAAAPPDMAILVTTDHGGVGHDHATSDPATMTTFVVARSRRLEAGSCWPSASILDVAPTVADLLGLVPLDHWEGRSLVGAAMPVVDWVLDGVRAMAAHHYGEDVDMLAHSLQTAERARAEGAADHMIVAGLLHDIGHTLGPVTEWGYPDHDTAGAFALQPFLPAEVVEPIRLHVAAKRWLVAVDPTYSEQLSRASVESLRQQGGPFTPSEVAAFSDRPGADDAIALRRWDDDGKVAERAGGRSGADLERMRPLVEAAVEANEPISARWARDACGCEDCRDPINGQRRFGVDELAGWRVHSVRRARDRAGLVVVVARDDGTRHECRIPATDEPTTGRSPGPKPLGAPTPAASIDEFLADVARDGLALMAGLGSEPGTVLDFAAQWGFVRHTNYGDLFDVRSEPAPVNLAYTAVGLPLHTDNPYRDPVPTVQLLHCLRDAATGGASRFCDGIAVAEQMRLDHPGHFAVLTSTPVSFRFAADRVDLRAEVPLISLDVDDRVQRVTVNNRSMQSLPPGPNAEPFYEAYEVFASLLADAAIELTLRPGELIAFDNRRILHGRRGFADDPDRHLQGCYVDIDAVHSRVRTTAG